MVNSCVRVKNLNWDFHMKVIMFSRIRETNNGVIVTGDNEFYSELSRNQ